MLSLVFISVAGCLAEAVLPESVQKEMDTEHPNLKAELIWP